MARSVGIAYGIAGAAVAAAIIVVAGSTVGFGEGAGSNARGESVAAGLAADLPLDGSSAGVTSSEIVTTATGEQVQYLYVDGSAGRRYDDDDRYEGVEHEHEHEDDD